MSMIAIADEIDKEAAIRYAKLCGGEYDGHVTIKISAMSGSIFVRDQDFDNEVAMKLLLVMFHSFKFMHPITLVLTKEEIKSTLLLKIKMDNKVMGLVQKRLIRKSDAYEKIVGMYDGLRNCSSIESVRGDDEVAFKEKKKYVKYFYEEDVQKKFNEATSADGLNELADWYGTYYAKQLKDVSVLEPL